MKSEEKDFIMVMSAVVIIFTIIFVITGYQTFSRGYADIVSLECCDGFVCSDTYYTQEDNLCHLSLCEGSMGILDKTNCTYQGKNITNKLKEFP